MSRSRIEKYLRHAKPSPAWQRGRKKVTDRQWLLILAFGIQGPRHLRLLGVGMPDFPDDKRRSRRKAGKRQRQARKANRCA